MNTSSEQDSGAAVTWRHRKAQVMLPVTCLSGSISQANTQPSEDRVRNSQPCVSRKGAAAGGSQPREMVAPLRWHPAAEVQSEGQASPALPGKREFPQRPAHCLQALICQGRHPFPRHLPPLVPAGLGFPLEARAGVGIRGHSQREQLCLHTACQASLPRARVSGCTGGRRGGLCLCSRGCRTSPSPLSVVFHPSSLSPSLFFYFFLFMCVSTHVVGDA